METTSPWNAKKEFVRLNDKLDRLCNGGTIGILQNEVKDLQKDVITLKAAQ